MTGLPRLASAVAIIGKVRRLVQETNTPSQSSRAPFCSTASKMLCDEMRATLKSSVWLKDATALNGMMNIQPVIDSGKMLGYKLSPGYDSRFFGKAGLKRNDVLTSINGVKLDSPNKALSLMSSLAFTDDLDITIDRGGEPMSFRYKFK